MYKMTEFLLLNVPEQIFDDAVESETPLQYICLCCLTENVPFIALDTCKHTMFFEHCFEFMIKPPRNFVCYQCHSILKKFQLFKQQVSDSFVRLNEQVPNSNTFNKSFIIKQTPIEIFEIPPEEPIGGEIKCEDDQLTNDVIDDEIQIFQIERNSSDFESDSPLSMNKSKEVLKRKAKTKVHNSKRVKKKTSMPILKLEKDPIVSEVEETTNLEIEYLEDEPDIKLLKIERYSSDLESDTPLCMLSKTKVPKTKEKPKKQRKKRPSVIEKYDGKIIVITLTTAEVMEEREREARRPGYLKLPYKCVNCITGFDHEMTLKEHMDKRHGKKEGGIECNICKSVLCSDTSYREHEKRHSRRYECRECGKRNVSVYSVVKHYNERHGTIKTSFTCQECGFVTESHRSYRYHRDKHKHKQQCSICGNTFVNATGLRVHMYTVHKQSSRVYSCEVCHKVYNARSGLLSHSTSVHSAQAGAYCGQCRVHFRTKQNLVHHLRTHLNHVSYSDRRFICDECGMKFVTKLALQEHIDWIHLKKTDYGCDKCHKVFKNSSALNKHYSYVHEKKRPPRNKICDYCGRSFTTLAILQTHIRTHTGERPLQCNYCTASFAHSAALYVHNKQIHSDIQKKKEDTEVIS